MRILIRTSKLAIWSRRLGSFAIPLVVIPVLMHRERIMDSDAFVVAGLVAVFIAALAVLLGLGAFVRLWYTGDRGWGLATTGILLGLLCLSPLALAGVQAARHPMTADVSTDPDTPPALLNTPRKPLAFVREDRAEVIASFPNAVTRTYQLQAPEVFALAEQLVSERGWDIRRRRAPGLTLDAGQINAIATTALGWRDEVAVRVTSTGDGSVVDMRSASLFSGGHDLGVNGRRIEAFLLDLDGLVTGRLRDGPSSGPDQALPAPRPNDR